MTVPLRPLDHVMMMMNELHFLTFGHTRGLILCKSIEFSRRSACAPCGAFSASFSSIFSLYILTRECRLFFGCRQISNRV